MLCHNLCVLIQAIHELGIEPAFEKDNFCRTHIVPTIKYFFYFVGTMWVHCNCKEGKIMAKSQFIKIRLSREEKQAFEQASALAGITLSAWMRERLRLVAIRELEGAGYLVPFIQRISLRTKNDACHA